MKKIWIGIAALLLVLAAGAWTWSRPAFQDWLLFKGISRQLKAVAPLAANEDGIRVILCGTSAPPPSKDRAKACTAVIAGSRIFIVDTGPGSANNLNLWRFSMNRITAILLTHFHSDHIGDLGEINMLSWAAGRSVPLPVYGPDGVQDVVAGFNQAYRDDEDYRTALHGLPTSGAALVARPFGLASDTQRKMHMADATIIDDNGLKITAFQVNHEPVYPAVGYRFDYKGRSVVISGDTIKWPNLVRHAMNADLLIHEGQSDDERRILAKALANAGDRELAKVISQISAYHATLQDAAAEANAAHVQLLVFNHIGPLPPDNALTRAVVTRGLNSVRSPDAWKLGQDGMVLDLPARTKDIKHSEIR